LNLPHNCVGRICDCAQAEETQTGAHWQKRDIAKIKEELGEHALFDYDETVEVVYTGDTTIDVFTALQASSSTISQPQSDEKHHLVDVETKKEGCCDDHGFDRINISTPNPLSQGPAAANPSIVCSEDDVVRSAELLQRAMVIITECTFLDDENSPGKARERSHIHLKDICDNAHLFQNAKLLVLTHFSQQYETKSVMKMIKDSLPDWLYAKTQLLFV
jgi:hypothetical protein